MHAQTLCTVFVTAHHTIAPHACRSRSHPSALMRRHGAKDRSVAASKRVSQCIGWAVHERSNEAPVPGEHPHKRAVPITARRRTHRAWGEAPATPTCQHPSRTIQHIMNHSAQSLSHTCQRSTGNRPGSRPWQPAPRGAFSSSRACPASRPRGQWSRVGPAERCWRTRAVFR